MRYLISAAVLALALAACGGSDGDDSKEAEPIDFAATVEACNADVQAALNEATNNVGEPLPPGAVMRAGDGGDSLDVSPLQVQPFLVDPSVAAALCALRETNAPDSVISKVSQVSGLDGRQEASWDGVELTYSYDGNSGFTGVFTAAE